MARRPAVIAYDISCQKRAYRVRRLLSAHRLNGQKSVAECWLTQREAQELFLLLTPHIHPETDRLALAWLDKRRPVLSAHSGTTHGFRSLQSPTRKRIYR